MVLGDMDRDEEDVNGWTSEEEIEEEEISDREDELPDLDEEQNGGNVINFP